MKNRKFFLLSVRRIVIFILLQLAVVYVSATVWNVDNIPMVHLQDAIRYVCDPDHELSAEARDSSDFYLHRLHKECGVQTVFVVADRVEHADCFRMAQDIGNKYGVGTKKDRKGLVVVIAVGDRRYFIAPGKGLEGDLTDIECDDIARACIVRNMKNNNVDLAVFQTSKAIFNKLKTGKTGVAQVDRGELDGEDGAMAVFFLVFIVFAMLALMQRYGTRKGGDAHNAGNKRKGRNDDDWFPPFIFGGGDGFHGSGGGGFGGGSFGGGSFGGGGAGGGW